MHQKTLRAALVFSISLNVYLLFLSGRVSGGVSCPTCEEVKELKMSTNTPSEFIPSRLVVTRTVPSFNILTFPRHSDIVSRTLQQRNVWAPRTVTSFVELTKFAKEKFNTTLNVLDVGANIGWFTLLSASLGHNVTAIEPLKPNVELMKKSIGTNPGFADHIVIKEMGVLDRDANCHMLSSQTNIADPNLICGDNQKLEEFKALHPFHRIRHSVEVHAIDDMLPTEKFDIVKIDIEGLELPAVLGAEQLFRRYRPVIIFSEFGPELMKQMGIDIQSVQGYLKYFHDMDYNITHDGNIIHNTDESRWSFTISAYDKKAILDIVFTDNRRPEWTSWLTDLQPRKPKPGTIDVVNLISTDRNSMN